MFSGLIVFQKDLAPKFFNEMCTLGLLLHRDKIDFVLEIKYSKK